VTRKHETATILSVAEEHFVGKIRKTAQTIV